MLLIDPFKHAEPADSPTSGFPASAASAKALNLMLEASWIPHGVR